MSLYIGSMIYCYDEKDKEHKAEVIRIEQRMKPKARKTECFVDTYIDAVIRKTKRHIYITNEVIHDEGWSWSYQPIPPIREGAIVEIDNWDRICKCEVLGWCEGGAHDHSFIFKGISSRKKPDNYSDSDIGRFKGHCFTASTDSVIKIISQGKGTRIMRLPFTPEKRQRQIFGY